MAAHLRKNEQFYAVYIGRLDKPAIYSSWSQVHPRVTGCSGEKQEKFKRLEDARNAMKSRGITEFDEFIKHDDKNKDMLSYQGKYYAVAGGKSTQVFNNWKDAEEEIKGTTASYERFSTEREAEEFIEEWKNAYADSWRWEIRQGLNNGWIPKDMKLDVGSFLVKMDSESLDAKFEQIDIKEEPQE